MITEIKSAKAGKIGKISVNVGDNIKKGSKLLDIEAHKGNEAMVSKNEGKIVSIQVEEGDVAKVGDILLTMECEIANAKPEKAQPKASNKATFDYFGSVMKPQKIELQSDITIIGGGPGGYVAAIKAAKLGAKVVLVEKEDLGGTCLNRGCIPTKALVRSAEMYSNMQRSEEFGLFADNISVDMGKVIERKNGVVNNLVAGIKYLMDKNKITVVEGSAKILSNEKVYVKDNRKETTINSKNIIIATGSTSFKLPIEGIESKNVLTSTEILDLKELPQKIVIIGGGVIGMEFAFMYNSFGVDVSVVEFMDNILPTLDSDVCEEISKIAKAKGIKLYTGSKVDKIIHAKDGECIVSFEKDSTTSNLVGNKVLVSVGRKPYYDNLGIEELGIALNENKRGIKVNNKMQTNIENIYAIGDVTNVLQLAHVASHQGIIAVENILGEDKEMDYSSVPSAIFTNPEIATVGICEKMISEKGLEVEVGKFPYAANGKALTLGEPEGFIKIIKDKESGKIIGSTIIGAHATDLIHELTLAIKNGLTAEQIAETIHAHPTTAEVIHEAALSVEGGALHFAE